MDYRFALRMIAMTGLAVLTTAACTSGGSTKARLSSGKICSAAGGTYANGTCRPGTNPQTAEQMCRAHGGIYFSGGDYCEVEGEWKY